MGGKNVFMCFVGVIPYGGEKNIHKIPRKSRDNPAKHVFMFYCLGKAQHDKILSN